MEVKTLPHSFAKLQTLPHRNIQISGGFWAEKQRLNREVTLPHGHDMLEREGHYHNLRVAAGLTQGEYRGFLFLDSDLYKWLEAAAWEAGQNPDSDLAQMVDETIALLAAVQEPDGYLNSYFQVTGKERFVDLVYAHELYCAGHLIEAAIAHHRATGKTTLLDIGRRLADHLDAVFGPGKKQGTSGHPEIELALVELYRETGEQRYLDLSLYFINERGQQKMRGFDIWGPAYHQDRVPVREASQVEGHAVRQLYLNAGVADLYLETGEAALLEAMLRLWEDMVAGKLYVTGGVGARHSGEAFGDAYELPSQRAYSETCAAVALMMWAWRMLLATADAQYADLMERTLYNSFLSGWSQDGKHFSYVNPLESLGRVERREWYDCACCPPNVMRQIASIGHYLATTSRDGFDGVQIHHFASARINASISGANGKNDVALTMTSDYPWSGIVQLTVDQTGDTPWTLSLRIPGWCSDATLRVNGRQVTAPSAGYATITRVWQAGDRVELVLTMAPRLIRAHPNIENLAHSVAIEYGPLVYCLEAADQEKGVELRHLSIQPDAHLQTRWRSDLLGGMMSVETTGIVSDFENWGKQLYRPLSQTHFSQRALPLTAVPYFAWANRGVGAMRVWLPLVNS